ncbi:MAG: glycosyltransferase [Actinomycetota bacterium]|nr:glycosyltransferase [Actinomycetota bacterium]
MTAVGSHETAPSVSVVIPTHDRPEFVRRAVRSVLDQDYAGEIECLVVFDACEPVDLAPSERRANRRVVTMTNERTRGALGARNTGLLAARSEIVAFLDDDDEWLPGKLAKQVELLRSRHADVVFTGVRFVAGDRYRDYVPALSADDPAVGLIGGGVFLPLQTMAAWRRSVEPDLLDERFPTGGDQELALRLVLRLPFATIPEPLVLMNRAHSNRLTMDYERMLGNIEYMREKHADLFRKYRPDPSRSHSRFALLALANRRRREARMWAARAVRANPKRPKNWAVAAAVLLLPPMSLDRIQALHHRLLWRRTAEVQR